MHLHICVCMCVVQTVGSKYMCSLYPWSHIINDTMLYITACNGLQTDVNGLQWSTVAQVCSLVGPPGS